MSECIESLNCKCKAPNTSSLVTFGTCNLPLTDSKASKTELGNIVSSNKKAYFHARDPAKVWHTPRRCKLD